MKKIVSMLVVLALMFSIAVSPAETLQDCHRFTLTKEDTTQDNKSVVRLWQLETANEQVTQELQAIAEEFVDRLGSDLPKAKNKTSGNSRLDVATRVSRTGLTWMSFLVQARTTYHRDLVAQEIASRTYDMTTGERITLKDIFAPDSAGWEKLAAAVEAQASAYFDGEEPETSKLDKLTGRESLEEMDFTLHGMSLVLHIPASRLYEGRQTLMEITLMYPEIRGDMTERAQQETDNDTYYKLCALTFDDGPTRTNTTLVLNSLLETGARATFFVIGNRIKDNADLVQREHDEGHAVGTHNWSHANVQKMSGSSMRSMVAKCDKALNNAIGLKPRYDRVPYGLYPQMIKAKVGWPLIQWSVDTYDWRGRSTRTVVNTVKDQIEDGDIILCHDIKDNTPESARQIAEYLAENGFMLLTVDELFAKDGVELKPNVVYYRCTDGNTSIKKR